MAKRKHRAGFRAARPVREQKRVPVTLNAADDGRGWMTVFDSGTDPGYWQKNLRPARDDSQRNWTVFACQTLIANDIGKLRLMLVEKINGVWQETESPAYSTLLRKPNGFQTWPQLSAQWQLSKQSRGNAYVLLERDDATRVAKFYVLHPDKVHPLVPPDGSVYYRLDHDDLAGVPEGVEVVVPGSEIMHDRMNCLFHPLVGLSPLFASALQANQALTIQEQSEIFFRNGSRPGGILASPQPITEAQAKTYKTNWETMVGGNNRGRVAVLGNGLKYESMAQTAVEADLAKQLDMTATQICATYHVPPFKIGVGTTTYQNAETLNQVYYDSCLQVLIENVESLIDDGLELSDVGGRTLRARFDLDGLLRMDRGSQIKALGEAVGGGIMAPDEARAKIDLPPVPGGKYPYLQQQNYSLEALAKRDTADDPFKTQQPSPEPAPPVAPAANDPSAEEAAAKELADLICKGLEYAA